MITGISLVLTVIALSVSRQLMALAGAQSDTIADANVYFRILMYFLPVNALTMCICAAQRGVGNTKLTMYVNIASNLVNVVFNYLLIGGNFGFPRLGVQGAAIATVIGFSVGLVLSVWTLIDRHGRGGFLRITRHDRWRLDGKTLLDIVKIGGNAMIEQVALRVGFFAYAMIVANLGTEAFAAHSICMQFLNISFSFGDGIGIAGTSLVGQMLGKKRKDLSKLYGRISQRMSLATSLVIALLIILFRNELVWLFAGPSDKESVMLLAAKVMIIVAIFQPLQMSSVVISGALRCAGDTRFIARVMCVCVAIIRPVLSFIAVYVLTHVVGRPDVALMGCWAASLVDMSVRLFFVNRRYNSGKWQNIVI
jgi:putative MATE family efflux protein